MPCSPSRYVIALVVEPVFMYPLSSVM